MKTRRAKVVYSYVPQNDDELRLEVDDVIEVMEEIEEGLPQTVIEYLINYYIIVSFVPKAGGKGLPQKELLVFFPRILSSK